MNEIESEGLIMEVKREIFGENSWGTDEANIVTQFKCMKNSRNRIAFQGSKTGPWVWYWLQNSVDAPSSYFARVGIDGDAAYDGASASFGVRPVFLLS